MRYLAVLVLLFIATTCGKQAPSSAIFDNCLQLVAVISPDEESTAATLYCFEKTDNNWQAASSPHVVMLGRSGLAWGYGLHEHQKGPRKKEGDGASPAGIFTFGPAFGYAPPESTAFKLPYGQATDVLECVDDSRSTFYNQLTDSLTVQKDWNSSEFMHRPDDLYKWGIFVNHNVPATPNNGSCIFFHIWKGLGEPTSGCTSMSEENLLAVMTWLDPARHPLLVQLTAGEYRRFQKKFGLPGVS